MGKEDHPQYSKMKDTPWIKQGREIANIGGKGVLSNYGKVNVFDQDTIDSLNARNNAVYQRAFSDMDQNYNNIMNKYAARNYNRFGSLNNTPAAYTTDQYQKDFQRQMNDLSYNKAVNYENLINNELQRRYNTLNMFANMYQYGKTPYEQDKMNWNVENTNKDMAFNNALISGNNNSNLFGNIVGGAVQGGLATGNPWGAVAGGAMGAIGGLM